MPGALVGTLTCIAATQDVGYAFGQVSNGAMSIAQYRAFVDNPRYVLASETRIIIRPQPVILRANSLYAI